MRSPGIPEASAGPAGAPHLQVSVWGPGDVPKALDAYV